VKAVRISWKAAVEILRISRLGLEPALDRALEQLHRATYPKDSWRPQTIKKAKVAKRQAKNDETALIRREVDRRAAGRCECCQVRLADWDPGEMDHFWGKKNAPQSVRNCWLLSRTCHRLKGATDPDRIHWLLKFGTHADRYGFRSEVAKVEAEIAAVEAANKADAIKRAAGGGH
jgi:5-methylcytosine-specific restriction endonuclease McrA